MNRFLERYIISLQQVAETLPHVRKELILQTSQNRGYWCPGDAGGQDISIHDIDYAEPG